MFDEGAKIAASVNYGANSIKSPRILSREMAEINKNLKTIRDLRETEILQPRHSIPSRFILNFSEERTIDEI
jgi:hypothetical protein